MKEKIEQLKKDDSWKERERRRLAQILGNVEDNYKIPKIIARISNLLDNTLSELKQAVREETRQEVLEILKNEIAKADKHEIAPLERVRIKLIQGSSEPN